MSDRARDVFRAVVDGYLRTGAPVGSKTIATGGSLNLSPASIRNVMGELEERGLLSSPHTSAGRMPTERGLRLFVDGMMQVSEPSPEERAAIERWSPLHNVRPRAEVAYPPALVTTSTRDDRVHPAHARKAVARLREQGHVYEDGGAVWLRTSTFGDDKDRVLIRADGQPTYFAADAAYYLDKKDRGFTEIGRPRIEPELSIRIDTTVSLKSVSRSIL